MVFHATVVEGLKGFVSFVLLFEPFSLVSSPELDIILSSHSSDVSIKDKCLVACKLTINICEKSLAALSLSLTSNFSPQTFSYQT